MAAPVKTKKKKGVVDTRIKAYGYVRVSTKMQEEDGDSFQTQGDIIRVYAEMKGVNLLVTYPETCSGATPFNKRPVMTQILDSIKNGHANAIIVSKLDRFSRRMKDIVNTLAAFEEQKIHFFCANPEIDTTTTTGMFTVHILGAIAQMERSIISDRVKEVMQNKKAHGHLVGSVPFGYDTKLEGDTKVLVPNEREQALITRIKAMRAVEKVTAKGKRRPTSYQAICITLSNERVLNKNGTTNWFPAQIRRICFDGDYRSGQQEESEEEEDS